MTSHVTGVEQEFDVNRLAFLRRALFETAAYHSLAVLREVGRRDKQSQSHNLMAHGPSCLGCWTWDWAWAWASFFHGTANADVPSI